MKPMRKLALLALAPFLAACESSTEPRITAARSELVTAPTSGTIAGQNVSVEPYLWRAFMPVSPPDGKPLVAIVRVRAAGAALSSTVTADSIWVISESSAWGSRAVQEKPRTDTGDVLEVIARDGPKWGPGTRVDVVVRLRDNTGRVIFVRASDHLISRTD